MIRGYIKRDQKGKFTRTRKRTERNEKSERRLKVMALGVLLGILAGISLDVGTREHVIVKEVKAEEVVVDLPEPLKEVQIEVVESAPIEVVVQLEVVYTKEDIQRIIKEKAEKYGVSFEKMSTTVACESGYKADIQSRHTLSYGREESWGVSQWHIPAKNRNAEGKIITKEMALDPYQALDAMAYHFSKGNAKIWTCYRMNYMQ